MKQRISVLLQVCYTAFAGNGKVPLFLILIFLGAIPVQGTVYYVAKNNPGGCSDSGPGTETEPWCTIQKAANTLVAGDTVYIKEGTYIERVIPQNSGLPGNYITYRNYPGDEVIIRSPNTWEYDYCILLPPDQGMQYIRFTGLKLKNANFANFGTSENGSSKSNIIIENTTSDSSYIGIYLSGFVDSEIKNCEISSNQFGIYLSGPNRNILIDSNHVSYSHIVHPERDPIWSHGIIIFTENGNISNENSYITITNNNVHHSKVQGILVYHGKNVLVRNNQCHHNGATGIQIESAGQPNQITRNIVVENNICEYNSQSYEDETGIWIDDTDNCLVQNNILRYNEIGLKITGCFQVIVRFNTVYENNHDKYINAGGISVQPSYERQEGGDEIVVHNAFYGNGGGSQLAQILIGMGSDLPELNRVIFKNNIVSESRSSVYNLDLWVHGLTHTLDYNDYFNPVRGLRVRWNQSGENVTPVTWSTYLSASGQDSHSVTSDPLFKDVDNEDFHVQFNSPCIDKGDYLTKTTSTGSGITIPVKDARYFSDGYGLIEGDSIHIGSNRSAKIVHVDYDANVITVNESVNWDNGDAVSYPYKGSAPDIGVFEHESFTHVEDDSSTSECMNFALYQNYPNPFNLTTEIDYRISVESRISIKIFNVLGVHVRTLINSWQRTGDYSIQWDGRDDYGGSIATGMYFYVLQSEECAEVKKCMILVHN